MLQTKNIVSVYTSSQASEQVETLHQLQLHHILTASHCSNDPSPKLSCQIRKNGTHFPYVSLKALRLLRLHKSDRYCVKNAKHKFLKEMLKTLLTGTPWQPPTANCGFLADCLFKEHHNNCLI